jgi:hypothetical protein
VAILRNVRSLWLMTTLVRDTRCNVTDSAGCDVGVAAIESRFDDKQDRRKQFGPAIPSVWDHDNAGASNSALSFRSSELSQLI